MHVLFLVVGSFQGRFLCIASFNYFFVVLSIVIDPFVASIFQLQVQRLVFAALQIVIHVQVDGGCMQGLIVPAGAIGALRDGPGRV